VQAVGQLRHVGNPELPFCSSGWYSVMNNTRFGSFRFAGTTYCVIMHARTHTDKKTDKSGVFTGKNGNGSVL